VNLPNQREVKIFIRDCLKHGDLVRLAEGEGVHLSAISQRFNPNLDTPCPAYQALKQLRSIAQVNKLAATKLWTFIVTTVEPWLENSELGSADDLLATIEQEHADVVIARIKHKPAHVQRKEVVELIEVLSRYADSLEAESDNVRRIG
jgi:hypothetical protein